MAANVGVLEIGQEITDSPRTYISKSHAKNMLRRLEAEEITKRLIRRVKIKAARIINGICQNLSKPFIPENLPPSIDKQIGVFSQIPALPNQVRFRHVAREAYLSSDQGLSTHL